MRYPVIPAKTRGRRHLCQAILFLAWLGCTSYSTLAMASGLESCLAQGLAQASNETTVGQLRAACRAQAQTDTSSAREPLAAVVDDRLKKDRDNALQPFTLMAHMPNYLLAGAFNFNGYRSDLFQQQFDDTSLQLHDLEFQFQISLKAPLGLNVLDTFDVYAAYTNRSFWQLYNSGISSPFRETNHEPEAWLQFTPGWKVLGFLNSSNAVGIVHQSNGRGGILSRSWNRVYANLVFERGGLALGFKPWLRIPENAAEDDNRDISDYLGHYEIRAAYKWGGHVFSLMSRNNLESGFRRGAVELAWSFPIWKYPYLKGYIQYFGGYGESLIDYNRQVNRLGIGITLTDWL